jgi:CRP-like cAMP-binding protein
MTAISSGGEEVVINTFKSGAFFPIGWMLNDTTNSYFYQAGEESEVFKMPKTEVRKFLESEPDILFDLMKRIYKGLDGYFMRMQYLMAGNAYSRLITELIILSKRFGQKTKGSDQILLKTTEKDLAAQTGITRETVSREFKKLIDKNIISFQTEHLIIKSLGDLEKELS